MDWIIGLGLMIAVLVIILFYDTWSQSKRDLEIKNKKDKEIQDLEKEKQALEDIVRSKFPKLDDNFYIERYYDVENIILVPNEKIYHVLTDNKKFRMSILEEDGTLSLNKWVEVKD